MGKQTSKKKSTALTMIAELTPQQRLKNFEETVNNPVRTSQKDLFNR